MAYEYAFLKARARELLNAYQRTHQHHLLCQAIRYTRLALVIRRWA